MAEEETEELRWKLLLITSYYFCVSHFPTAGLIKVFLPRHTAGRPLTPDVSETQPEMMKTGASSLLAGSCSAVCQQLDLMFAH